MPFDPTTGVYTAPSNSWNPAVAGTVIDPTDWNSTQIDYEEALTLLNVIASSIIEDRTTGGTVTVADDARGYRCTSGVASNLTFNLGAAADRARMPFTVVLDGADPSTYTITVDFDGAETCRGVGSFVFESPYQVVTFYPTPAGTGWYIG